MCLPLGEDLFPSLFGELDGSSRKGFEVVRPHLSAIDQGESESVGGERSELFHQVQHKRRFPWPQTMQESYIRVQADLLTRTVHDRTSQPVQEGRQRIGRIRGRAFNPA